jgi:hypothetical protein
MEYSLFVNFILCFPSGVVTKRMGYTYLCNHHERFPSNLMSPFLQLATILVIILLAGLDLPNTGILGVLPFAQVYGLHHKTGD